MDGARNGDATEKPVRLVLLDELSLFRMSLGHFLAAEPGLEVAGQCATGAEVLEVLKRSPVDLVLSDFEVHLEDGGDFMTAARQAGYQGRFMILAEAPDAQKSASALKQGASGVFLKSDEPGRLIQAIRLVVSGGVWIDRKIVWLLVDRLIDRPIEKAHRCPNTLPDDREQKVLRGIVEGLSNRKIGGYMGLSESSVKNIVQRLFARAGVRTRSQLVRAALENSLNFGWGPGARQHIETVIDDRRPE